MKTYILPQEKIKRKWYLIDANGQILGRLAAKIADIIRGKNKPHWSPHQDLGDYVVVINAAKVKITGKKLNDKIYYRHSGYPGGIKKETLKELLEKDPTRVIHRAVWGMIPHNRLGRQIIKKLKVYPGSDHPHQAQKLEEYKIK